MSSDSTNRAEYSDNDVPVDEKVKQRLLEHGSSGSLLFSTVFSLLTSSSLPSGLDEPLAHHIAHLYIRDPLVIFTETLDQDNSLSTDHFEVRPCSLSRLSLAAMLTLVLSLRRTSNQQTGRPSGSSLLRPTRPSAGESSSGAWRSSPPILRTPPTPSSSSFLPELSSASVLISTSPSRRFVPSAFPLSSRSRLADSSPRCFRQVDENMNRAQVKDAVSEQKFFFRKSVFPGRSLNKHDIRSRPPSPPSSSAPSPISHYPTSRPVSWAGNSVPPSPTFINGFAHAPPLLNGNGYALPSRTSSGGDATRPSTPSGPVEDEYEEMTVNEIINGKVSLTSSRCEEREQKAGRTSSS